MDLVEVLSASVMLKLCSDEQWKSKSATKRKDWNVDEHSPVSVGE